ncbi:MAG: hypothetical protein ACKVE3_04580 [Dissulfuribacterales bacterium]
MSVKVSVISQQESLKNNAKTYINNILESKGYTLTNRLPKFGIEIIIEDATFGVISNNKIKTYSIIISVNYIVFYYLWSYLLKNQEKSKIIIEKMHTISDRLEKENKYSTGANGIYKHNVYHNVIIVETSELENTCLAIVSDFNDMVLTWKEQTNALSEMVENLNLDN